MTRAERLALLRDTPDPVAVLEGLLGETGMATTTTRAGERGDTWMSVMSSRLPPLFARLVLPTLLLGSLASCTGLPTTPAPGVTTLVGAGGGAAAGGLLGSALGHGKSAITAGSTLVGLLAGGAVGRLLDQGAKAPLQTALQQAQQAPTGTQVPWTNPQTGQHGTLTSGVWKQRPQGLCRTYTITAVIEGTFADIEGCAVQRPDGTWEMLRER